MKASIVFAISPIFAVVSIFFANLIPSVVRSIKTVIITVFSFIVAASICAYISSSVWFPISSSAVSKISCLSVSSSSDSISILL